jgi:hypothetical protein
MSAIFLGLFYSPLTHTIQATPSIKILTQSRLIQRKIYRNEQDQIWLSASLLGDQGEVLAGIPINIYCQSSLKKNDIVGETHMIASSKTSFEGTIKIDIQKACKSWPKLSLWSWKTDQFFKLLVVVADSSISKGFKQVLNFQLIQQKTVLLWESIMTQWRKGKPLLHVSITAKAEDEERINRSIQVSLYPCIESLKYSDNLSLIRKNITNSTPEIVKTSYHLIRDQSLLFKIPQAGCYWLKASMNTTWRKVKSIYKKIWVPIDLHSSITPSFRLYMGAQRIKHYIQFNEVDPLWNAKGLALFNRYQNYKLPKILEATLEIQTSSLNQPSTDSHTPQILLHKQIQWELKESWTGAFDIPKVNTPVRLSIRVKPQFNIRFIPLDTKYLPLKKHTLLFRLWWFFPIALFIIFFIRSKINLLAPAINKVDESQESIMSFRWEKNDQTTIISEPITIKRCTIHAFNALSHTSISATLYLVSPPTKFAGWSVLKLEPPKHSILHTWQLNKRGLIIDLNDLIDIDQDYWLWVYSPNYEACAIHLNHDFLNASLSIPLWPFRNALVRQAQHVLSTLDIDCFIGKNSFTNIYQELQKHIHANSTEIIKVLYQMEKVLYHKQSIDKIIFLRLIRDLGMYHAINHFAHHDVRNHWSIVDHLPDDLILK